MKGTLFVVQSSVLSACVFCGLSKVGSKVNKLVMRDPIATPSEEMKNSVSYLK
jgi:hypothetical protein